jgi:S1-C subfamily serine protease
MLSLLGYSVGTPDGFNGPKTSAAIMAFQASVSQKPDGMVSESLRLRLQSALAERGANPQQPGRASDDTKPVSSGTGFFIGSDTLVSNHHVVSECTEVRLRKRGVDVGKAVVIATSRGDDLAALKSDKPQEAFLKLRISVPIKAAEAILVFGYPLSSVLSSHGNTTLGNVTALTGLRDDSRYIQISASIQPGNSGGPVLDESGRLVGVVEGKLDALRVARATGDIPQNVNFAIRSTTLATFLELNQLAYQVANTSSSFSMTQLADLAESASVQLECRK